MDKYFQHEPFMESVRAEQGMRCLPLLLSALLPFDQISVIQKRIILLERLVG